MVGLLFGDEVAKPSERFEDELPVVLERRVLLGSQVRYEAFQGKGISGFGFADRGSDVAQRIGRFKPLNHAPVLFQDSETQVFIETDPLFARAIPRALQLIGSNVERLGY
ncbi:hypothetical protein [Stenotrophomonas sepilia]|uniref:hypothetical protein n=1 Tax=Stenotrophomonas sepilia TaxID=2860290 RepID=UPI0011B3B0BA|nr:hypothetical protein [Stenotrophomonas sepilia]